MHFRITRRPETGRIRKPENVIHELVGYVEADSQLEALNEAREEYGDDVYLRKINCHPDDDVWPPEEHPQYTGLDPDYGDYGED